MSVSGEYQSRMMKAEAEAGSLKRKIIKLEAERDQARGYALGLAGVLHRKHFSHVTEWKALPDLLGLLTQIDNMSSSLVTSAALANETERCAKIEVELIDEVLAIISLHASSCEANALRFVARDIAALHTKEAT